MKKFLILQSITLFMFCAQGVSAETITRANRWEGSIRGCLSNMKKNDPNIDSKMFSHLICACVATDLINSCAPADSTPTDNVVSCMQKRATQMVKLVSRCQKEMPLKF